MNKTILNKQEKTKQIKCKKAQKGVTLIALVITIIVLLILAGITLNLALDENGIIRRAIGVSKDYKEAEQNELIGMQEFGNLLDNILLGGTGKTNEPEVKPITKITLSKETTTILRGRTEKLTAIIEPNDATNTELKWTSSEESIATVENGEITALAEGETEIRAEAQDGSGISASCNVKVQNYEIVDEVPVPVGFHHVEGTTISSGFVIKNNTDGNEFVWIPVNNPEDYQRIYWVGGNQLTDFTEEKPTDELESITKYFGYYIGRYESGIEGYDETVNMTNDSKLEEWTGYNGGHISIQKGKQVWNYITRNEAKKVSESLYNKVNNGVASKLCSSYAWDSALSFIKKTHSGYPTSSKEGNYWDTEINYTDLSGETKKKENNTQEVIPTGQTTAVNNIYDMAGNVWEWTTELRVSDDGGVPYVRRGGCYLDYFDGEPAGSRENYSPSSDGAHIGFRVTLFL